MEIRTPTGKSIKLQTGDELLCSGSGRMSKAIIWYNKLMGVRGDAQQLSHVAKYIRGNVFEATTLNEWCDKRGYQYNPFDLWLYNYPGKVWVRQTEGCDICESEYITHAVRLLGTPYESGIPGLIELMLTSAAIRTKWFSQFARNRLRTKELHCSEANVKLSQFGGYYDLSIRPNKMPPYQFWPGYRYEKGFIKGVLKPPLRIK
jgi:hypothetical protein